MKCYKCGSLIEKTSLYCPKCGSRIKKEPTIIDSVDLTVGSISKKIEDNSKTAYNKLCTYGIIAPIALSIVCVMVLTLLSIPAKIKSKYMRDAKAAIEDMGIKYDQTKEGIVITACNGNDTNVEIPKKIDGLPVVKIQCFNSYNGQDNQVESVIVPATVKEIDGYSFNRCTSLKKVVLNDGISCIGSNAFARTSLEEINLPNSITRIGSNVFEGCNNLKSIDLPTGIEKMGISVFRSSGIEEIVFPASLKTVPDDCFKDCSELRKVTINKGTETIGSRAFSGCSSLKTIEIPGSLKSVGYCAFDRCSSLETVVLSGDVDDNVLDMLPEVTIIKE